MRKIILLTIFLIPGLVAQAQWNVSGTNLYPTNYSTMNVGIGTTTPGSNLEVVGAGTMAVMKVRHQTENADWGLMIRQTSDLKGLIACSGRDLSIESGWNKSLILGNAQYDANNGKVLFPGGKIGIGTTTPLERLHVTGRMYLEGTDNYPDGSMKSYFHWRGHSLILGSEEGTYTHNTVELKPGGSTSGQLESNFKMFSTPAPNNFALKVYLTSNGNSFFNAGNIGIGTTAPDQKLSVKGKIHAEEVILDLNVPGPDYVFENSYKLPSLEELNAYIKINKHLPEVPAACTMEERGVNVGEMNMILLKKVEELTLYLIDQQKINQNQSERISQLEAVIKSGLAQK